jgi:hypothetical protein
VSVPERRELRGASEHGDGCECVRCRGFEPANQLARRHGAYSELKLAPRAQELAVLIRERLPVFSPLDEFAVGLAALALARAEQGAAALAAADAAGGPRPERLEQDVRGWVGTARRLLADLGATPRSRAELARDLGVAASTQAARRQLEDYLGRHYGDRDGRGGDGGGS